MVVEVLEGDAHCVAKCDFLATIATPLPFHTNARIGALDVVGGGGPCHLARFSRHLGKEAGQRVAAT